jgi:phosphoglycolate phosphatase
MIELVIFDADGVLFESDESNIAYYNAIFRALGEPELSGDEAQAAISYSAGQLFELRAGGDRALVERMHQAGAGLDFSAFFALLRPHVELRPFMTALRSRYRIAVATNRSATIPALLHHLNIADLLDAVASARDQGVRPKPAPDILELCVRRAGVQPSAAIYVGDSQIDRHAAEAAGTHFIGVGPRIDAPHRIDTLAELPAVLERMFNHKRGA